MQHRDEKIKLLIIAPAMGGGGAERVLLNILSLMDRTQYEIHLFLGEKKGVLLREVPNDIKIYSLYSTAFIKKIVSQLYIRFGSKVLLKYFGKKVRGEFDVGISFLDSVTSEFLFYNKARIKKKVIVIHSSYKTYNNRNKFIKGKHFLRMKRRYLKTDSIVFVANEAKKEFRELFGDVSKDMRVIYNPLNISDILDKSNEGAPEELSEDVSNILAIGSLIPVKNHKSLIQACKKLKDENIDFKLHILGDGFLREKLQLLIEENALKEYVKLVGFVSNPYVWLKHSDVFVMTSIAEGLPTALCEALILGKPVLVTNVPGCREVINYGENGCLVENDIESIAKGLKLLITDETKKRFYQKKSIERSKVFNDAVALKEYSKIFNGYG